MPCKSIFIYRLYTNVEHRINFGFGCIPHLYGFGCWLLLLFLSSMVNPCHGYALCPSGFFWDGGYYPISFA